MHAAGGEDVVLALGHFAALGRQAHQGEVRGTAADVDDQYQFFTLDGRLVVEGRGNRFVLEGDFLEADLPGDFGQGIFGFLVGSLVLIDKKHRAAQYHFIEGPAGIGLGALFQLADKHAQQVLERQGGAQHTGVVLDQLGAQQALERAHQAAFIAFQVLVQGQAAVDRATFFDIEEHHRGQGDLAVLQLDQRLHTRAMPTDGGIGRAKVDTASTGWGCVFHVACTFRKKTAAQCMPVIDRIEGRLSVYSP
ncbi:hypothetical protein D3C80_1102720 [compost metagenome]